MRLTKVEVPIIYHGDEKWLLLNHLSNRGILRAVQISKSQHVADTDGHHCEEVRCKSSIRYHAKQWGIDL